MSARRAARPVIDVSIAGSAWTRALRNAASITRHAAGAALAGARTKGTVEVSILLTSDAAIRKLNCAYRNKDKPTNVLSFPADASMSLPKGEALPLGDVVVALGVAKREAAADGKTLTAHLSHLVVHGVLHLLGYDHEGDKDALTMERLERTILARMGIADPYDPAPRKVARKPSGAPVRKRA